MYSDKYYFNFAERGTVYLQLIILTGTIWQFIARHPYKNVLRGVKQLQKVSFINLNLQFIVNNNIHSFTEKDNLPKANNFFHRYNGY